MTCFPSLSLSLSLVRALIYLLFSKRRKERKRRDLCLSPSVALPSSSPSSAAALGAPADEGKPLRQRLRLPGRLPRQAGLALRLLEGEADLLVDELLGSGVWFGEREGGRG